MRRTVVVDVVGLTPGLIDDHMPNLQRFAQRGAQRNLGTVLPAVTCAAQSTFVTGTMPSDHGSVGNGWYFRDLSEVWFWRQSNALVSGEKIWDAGKRRDPSFSCAKMFWWYNMHSSADLAVTPRPMYPADGRKLPDIYSTPAQLRDELTRKLGTFPLFNFWGPTADIVSSRWIARASQHVFDKYAPTLSLVYLPHLDYNLQRIGPNAPAISRDLAEIDTVCGELIDHFERQGARVVILSEYGIVPVSDAVHINRALREAGMLGIREELGRELLDPGACAAFAVADHQVAHIYVKDAARIPEVKALIESLDGVDVVHDAAGKKTVGLAHERSGELVAVSKADRWFSYYYWLDDDRAPDFARTVDIHRKPGYDPVELFVDPKLRAPKLKVGLRLAQKALGFRYLMDLIPLDTSLVRGSHGRLPDRSEDGPVLLSNAPELLPVGDISACDVKALVLQHVFA